MLLIEQERQGYRENGKGAFEQSGRADADRRDVQCRPVARRQTSLKAPIPAGAILLPQRADYDAVQRHHGHHDVAAMKNGPQSDRVKNEFLKQHQKERHHGKEVDRKNYFASLARQPRHYRADADQHQGQK